MSLFENRQAAANELAQKLCFLKNENPIVLGLPNGGVPMAATVAHSLDAALDILLIAKLSMPDHPKQIVGAVDEHGRISMIQSAARLYHVTAQELIGPARDAFADLQRRRARFRAVMPETNVRGRTVIIVDQGVETGATMLGAIASVRDRGARRVVVTAPAGTGKGTWQLHETADGVVIPHTPSRFNGIEDFYETFDEVSDREVEATLQRWAATRPEQHPGVKTLVMRVVADQQRVLHCELDLPPGTTRGSGPYPAVIFAHTRESDGHSPRTVPISRRLAKRNLVGVRIDFSGHGRSDGSFEEATDERMLADLRTIFDSVQLLHEVDPARIGINAAGTAINIALRFAAERPDVAAIVIRGPLTADEIEITSEVQAPTLLIHGEHDSESSDLGLSLDEDLAPIHRLLMIPESNRWFNDPISLELMVSASVDWLADHLAGSGPPAELHPPTRVTETDT